MNDLIQPSEENKLFEKLLAYYNQIYPGVVFRKEEIELSPEQVGELFYTYPGAESEATFNEEVKMIEEALAYGYDTPLILLKKGEDYIVLDGHRRANVAFRMKLKWKALVLVPDKEVDFGIEKMIIGRVREKFS